MGCSQKYSSDCISYQGASFPQLEITTQLTNMSEVEEIVLEKILLFLDGSGIDLSGLTYSSTDIVNRLVGKDRTLNNVTQALLDQVYANTQLIDEIDSIVTTAVTYNTKCLTVSENTTKGVIQAVIDMLCEVDTDISNLTDQITGGTLATTIDNRIGNFLISNVNGIGNFGINKSGTGSNATLTFVNGIPPFTPSWCYAPLSYWNSDGTGKTGTPFEGWFICNGLNGTIDMRGWTAAGATNLPGINGATLNTTVDPDAQSDPTIASTILERKGEVKHQITIAELPSHNHGLTGTDHVHKINASSTPLLQGIESTSPSVYGLTNEDTGFQIDSISNTIPGSTDSVGSNTKGENRQPTVYGYYIVKLI